MALILCPDCKREHSDAAVSCPGCGRPVAVLPTPSTSRAFPESGLAGEVLAGKYQLDRLIGRGGMASVYKATRLDLQMPVAVKIISPQVAEEDDFSERFVREARIQFLLQHPGIVRVFDLIRDQGWLGLAMDWIEGDNLLQFLKRQTQAPSAMQIMELFFPILDALAYAHHQHVIHRDIKPGNILLQPYGNSFQPKITDFGIAKMVGDDHQTLSHVSLGTPTYMSPEQIEGLRDVDHRTDIYSMGVLLFRMVAGRAPFRGPNAMATSMAHLRDEIPLVRSKLPSADARFDAVIQIAMAKDPNERFPDCAAFATALKHALQYPRALPPSLQKEMSSRATAVDMNMDWMTNFSNPEVEAQHLSAPPSTSSDFLADDVQGKTEILSSVDLPTGSRDGLLQIDATGAHSMQFSSEDAQGSTGELIRQATGRNSTFPNRSKVPVAIGAVVGLLAVLLGGWWFFGQGEPSQPKVLLTLTSRPSGASVMLDGRPIGKTPLKYQSTAPKGKKLVTGTLTLTLEGHEADPITWERRRSLTANAILFPLAKMTIETVPKGAKVSVNGVVVGRSPLTFQRRMGQTYQIRLEKKGNVPKDFSWRATAKRDRRKFHLAPKIW